MRKQTLTNRDLLRKLVAFDSTSEKSNVPIADFICEYLDRREIDLQRFPDASGSKVNILARIGPEDCISDGLMLSGHLDVVGADEPGWTTDPFQLAERDGAYFGRGACDMKGFIALAVNRFAATDPASLIRPLLLLLTFDEELGSLGARAFAQMQSPAPALPKFAIIGEPTSLRVARMHKGHLKVRISVPGKAAHSAFPHRGANAIERAMMILRRLIWFKETMQSMRVESSDFFPDTPFPLLNIARIEGGRAINVIPDRCVIEVGIRLLPGMDSAQTIQRLAATVASRRVSRRTTQAVVHGPHSQSAARETSIEVINDSPPMLLAEDSPLHVALCELVGQTGSVGVDFSSDAGVLQQELGLECVLFGPGSIDVAHRANEYLPIDEFNRAGDLLPQIVRRFCIEDRHRRSPSGASPHEETRDEEVKQPNG